MTEDHLMNEHLFTQFCGQMYAELIKHKDNKTALGAMSPENVYSLSILEVKNRLRLIATSTDVKFIKKQDVHMANYLFFMWCKMHEVERLNK